MFTKFCDYLERAICLVISGFMTAIVLIVLVSVIYRYILHSPFAWTEQAARILFIWNTFLAAAVLYRKNMHIALDFFLKKLPVAVKSKVSFLNEIIMLPIIIVLFVYGIDLTILSLNQTFGALSISPSTFYAAAPVFSVLTFIYWIEKNVLKYFRRNKDTVRVGH